MAVLYSRESARVTRSISLSSQFRNYDHASVGPFPALVKAGGGCAHQSNAAKQPYRAQTGRLVQPPNRSRWMFGEPPRPRLFSGRLRRYSLDGVAPRL